MGSKHDILRELRHWMKKLLGIIAGVYKSGFLLMSVAN